MGVSIARTAGGRWQAFMDAAAERVQSAARQHDGEESACARNILQTTAAWSAWEREMGAALRPVAGFRSHSKQIRELRQAGFTWVHRAAPFRHLRTHNVRGAARKRIISALHGPYAHYDLAIVAEHEIYQRSVCHSFCARQVAQSLLNDQLYGKSMLRYRVLYMEYFEAFSQVHTAEQGMKASVDLKLLPMLKRQLTEMREAILDYPRRIPWLTEEVVIRSPHGDTQVLNHLDSF